MADVCRYVFRKTQPHQTFEKEEFSTDVWVWYKAIFESPVRVEVMDGVTERILFELEAIKKDGIVVEYRSDRI